MTATATAAVNTGTVFEVVWGCDETDRETHITIPGVITPFAAEALATKTYISLLNAGRRVGLYRDGVLIAGQDPDWVAYEARIAAFEAALDAGEVEFGPILPEQQIPGLAALVERLTA